MAETLRLTAPLRARGSAAAVVLTDEQVAALGDGKKTFPVKVTVNGEAELDLRVARMAGENLVGFSKAARGTAKVESGDTLDLVIEADATERTVEVPDDLAKAMADAGVADAFAALAPSHRKEYVRWIVEAKKPETRQKRINEAVRRVGEGEPRR